MKPLCGGFRRVKRMRTAQTAMNHLQDRITGGLGHVAWMGSANNSQMCGAGADAANIWPQARTDSTQKEEKHTWHCEHI